MAHFHAHVHGKSTGKILLASLAVTLVFVAVEALAGLRSGSLALLSDAGHNFTDAFGLGLAAAGFYFAAKPGDPEVARKLTEGRDGRVQG